MGKDGEMSSRNRSNTSQEVIKRVIRREVNNLYEFGEFHLDPHERVLWRGDEPVALPPKVFDTLFLLVERHGHIFSKREMMDALWTDSFVEESNLTQNIYTLRRILGTDENGKSFIENVPRRGYRFTAPVRVVEATELGVNGKEEENSDALPLSADNNRNETASNDEYQIKYEEQGAKNENPKFIISPSLIRFGIGAILLATLGFAGFRFLQPSVEKKSFAPIETVNFQKLTFTGDLTFPVLAPDGNSIAFVRSNDLFVQDVNTGDEISLNVAGKKVFGILQFSPDGSSLYFRDRVGFDVPATVFQVSRFGGNPKLAAENVWSGFGFSPDGKRMAFVRTNPSEAQSSLIIKNLETGEEKKLSTLNMPSEFLDNGHPAWSADGKKIAVVIFKKLPGSPASQPIIIDTETEEIEEINISQLPQFEQVGYLPGSNDLIVSAREKGKFFQLWRLALPGGELQKITNDLNIYRGISLSADGKKLLARQFTFYSHLWTANGNDLEDARQKTFGNLSRDGVGGINWMPNGDILYIARIMGDYDLWLYRASDDSRKQLTKNTGDLHQSPVASSDGKFIFFNSNRSATSHIWRMDANGANQTQITFGENESETHAQISPDGNWLYYLQKSQAGSTIWRKSLVDGRAEALTETGKLAPSNFLSLSPDGKFLAFHNSVENVNEESGKHNYQIGVIPVEKGAVAPKFLSIAASRLVVRWNSNGTALDYVENNSEGARIWRQSLDTSQPPTIIAKLPQAFLHNFAWSANGERLALSRGRQLNDAVLLTNFQP
jgi:DNA-binding winged helix-turn-helix (wHTH) protein/Tol biopolymer transport system component